MIDQKKLIEDVRTILNMLNEGTSGDDDFKYKDGYLMLFNQVTDTIRDLTETIVKAEAIVTDTIEKAE